VKCKIQQHPRSRPPQLKAYPNVNPGPRLRAPPCQQILGVIITIHLSPLDEHHTQPPDSLVNRIAELRLTSKPSKRSRNLENLMLPISFPVIIIRVFCGCLISNLLTSYKLTNFRISYNPISTQIAELEGNEAPWHLLQVYHSKIRLEKKKSLSSGDPVTQHSCLSKAYSSTSSLAQVPSYHHYMISVTDQQQQRYLHKPEFGSSLPWSGYGVTV
jgi:hypothetical protein